MTDDRYQPQLLTPGRRAPSRWADGLIWAVLGLMVLALLVGIAVGKVLYA